jgi:hypothetical protein
MIFMNKLKELIKSPHVQIALATAVSIIALAYFSKRVLPEPIDNLSTAVPPFIALIFESVLSKHKNTKIATTWYWVAAILLSSALIILLYAV